MVSMHGWIAIANHVLSKQSLQAPARSLATLINVLSESVLSVRHFRKHGEVGDHVAIIQKFHLAGDDEPPSFFY